MPQLKNTTTENKENKESGTKRAKTTPPPPRRAGASVSALTAKSSSSSNDETSGMGVAPSATGDKFPQMEARDGDVGIAAGYHATEYSKEGAPEGEAFKPLSNNGAGVDSSFVNHGSQDTNGDISGRRLFVSRTKVSRKYLCYPRYENGKILIQGDYGYPLTFKEDKDWSKVKELGHGEYGKCWSIRERNMCVKESLVVNVNTVNDFRKEVEVMMKVGQHENVVEFYGATYEKQKIHIFMELMPGGTMKALIDRYKRSNRRIDTRLIRKWTIQCMSGLVHLHKKGIAHNDIQALNILLDSAFGIRICLADFDNSSLRCDKCKSCNELSTYDQSCDGCDTSNCGECGEWKDGLKDDILEIAILVYQLVSVPRKVEDNRVWNEGVKSIGRRDRILGKFAAACEKFRCSQDLLEILTPSTTVSRQE